MAWHLGFLFFDMSTWLYLFYYLILKIKFIIYLKLQKGIKYCKYIIIKKRRSIKPNIWNNVKRLRLPTRKFQSSNKIPSAFLPQPLSFLLPFVSRSELGLKSSTHHRLASVRVLRNNMLVEQGGKKFKVSEEESDYIDKELVFSIEKLQQVQDELEKVTFCAHYSKYIYIKLNTPIIFVLVFFFPLMMI